MFNVMIVDNKRKRRDSSDPVVHKIIIKFI